MNVSHFSRVKSKQDTFKYIALGDVFEVALLTLRAEKRVGSFRLSHNICEASMIFDSSIIICTDCESIPKLYEFAVLRFPDVIHFYSLFVGSVCMT